MFYYLDANIANIRAKGERFMGRNILHVDANAFYASVEQQRRPELRDKPVAVCGSQEERHGIVLTASYPAKRRGVKTGMAIWQARQHCPELIVLPPDMSEYMRISRLARNIYERYTDQVEPFGLDEAWLDITGSVDLFGTPMQIAQEISDRVKYELGITVSIGVSDNKVTAKLGSDYKKPDAITRIERDNYAEIVYTEGGNFRRPTTCGHPAKGARCSSCWLLRQIIQKGRPLWKSGMYL